MAGFRMHRATTTGAAGVVLVALLVAACGPSKAGALAPKSSTSARPVGNQNLGIGGGGGGGPNPLPSLSVSGSSATLGDPCLVGEWRQTGGQAEWQLPRHMYPDYLLTGGAGSLLYVYPNGSTGWVFNGSAPYTYNTTAFGTGTPLMLSETLTGSVSGMFLVGSAVHSAGFPADGIEVWRTGDEFGSSGGYDVLNTVNGTYASEAFNGQYQNTFVQNVPFEGAGGTYTCNATTFSASDFFEPGTTTSFTRVGNI